MKDAILLLLLIFAADAVSRPFKKVIPQGSPNAKCLDGSPPALYIDWGTTRQNYLIFFNGGGYCAGVEISGTLQTCYQRTKTQFGSSHLLPEEFDAEGYLSTDPQINPYANWTKVMVNYCDGSLHQGYVKQPIQYKDTYLYFRGAENVRSHLKWLIDHHELSNAKRVMLTGVSAGAMATFMWADYVRSLLKHPEGLFMVIDSGIFLNEPSVRTGMLKLGVSFENLYKVANADEDTPMTNCNKFYAGEQYKCFFLQHALEFTIGPNIYIQSQYDMWSIPNILDVFCLAPSETGTTLANCNASQLQAIDNYRSKVMTLTGEILKRKDNSVWSISCANHGYALLNKFYNTAAQRVSGHTVKDAIEAFLAGNQVTLVDEEAWPQNKPCAY